jgi:hypothetical protein
MQHLAVIRIPEGRPVFGINEICTPEGFFLGVYNFSLPVQIHRNKEKE